MVHGIMQTLGGHIALANTEAGGTRAIALLPEAPAETGTKATTLPRGGGRVLLVDDEPSITRLGSVLLERLGYEVSVCTSSLGAAAWFKQSPER